MTHNLGMLETSSFPLLLLVITMIASEMETERSEDSLSNEMLLVPRTRMKT